ncbi:acetyltransferase [Aliivibrio fischeri]|uniref:GNAT family N-acetyltransferase n=1 Tax=Aliivibrio fischeri TaxID=668 RepID=UPI0002DE8880|nr:GNAT family N-acetyltransferase [Aliivibrio fischeri]OCH27553.1 acetyltransferase [Aliivibrio fischeri]OEE12286.1 acetyltransferase [Aliivibrio fischeri ZF-211]
MNVITHDPDNKCYLIALEGDAAAKVYYEKKGNILDVISTRIPDELQGKGYGKVMMESFLHEMRASNLLIVPVCSYVVHYMNKNPQWQDLLAK